LGLRAGRRNYLWSVAADATNDVVLYIFDRAAHVWIASTNFGRLFGSSSVVFGAVNATSDGYLYGSQNCSGQIYRFLLLTTDSAVKVHRPGDQHQ
jgi:hypothetical protein